MMRIVMAWLLVPALVFSQMTANSGKNYKMIRSNVAFQNFKVENLKDPVSEFTFPIQIIWPINPEFTLQIAHTPASAQFGTYRLSGLSDTYIKGTYLFLNKKGLVSLGLGLPTGVTELEATQFYVSQFLNSTALRFQLPVFGQGFTGNLGICMAHQVNDKLTLGGGANYILRNKYKPVQNSYPDYNPGDVVGVNVGADFQVRENAKLFCDLVYTIYFPDQLRGRETFGAGAKLNLEVGTLVNYELITVMANACFRQRGKNEYYTGTALEPESKNSNGPQVEFDGTVRYALNEQTGALGYAILRAHGENEYRSGDAAVFGIGGGLDSKITAQFMVNLGFKGYFGRIGGGSAAQSLSGFELFFGWIYQF